MAGMDIAQVKQQYGDKITLFGNVDCGNLLSFKQPEDVYEAVRNCIRGAGEFRSGDAVPDVVYREKHRTVREFSVWSDAQRHIAFPDQSFLSHEF